SLSSDKSSDVRSIGSGSEDYGGPTLRFGAKEDSLPRFASAGVDSNFEFLAEKRKRRGPEYNWA
ncbi:hypothetical protein E4U23_000142, partial [Claviceps purpurea]